MYVYTSLVMFSPTTDEDDYVAINPLSGSPLTEPFNNATRVQSFNITIRDDLLFELTEEFTVTALPPANLAGTVMIRPSFTTIRILDDDSK